MGKNLWNIFLFLENSNNNKLKAVSNRVKLLLELTKQLTSVNIDIYTNIDIALKLWQHHFKKRASAASVQMHDDSS